MTANINTAPAAKSFVCLIASSYSGDTLSHNASIAELTPSAASTAPIHKITAIHSKVESPNSPPATITHGHRTVYPCIMFPADKPNYAPPRILETINPILDTESFIFHRITPLHVQTIVIPEYKDKTDL